jgi:hypothetical protein
VSRIPTHAFGYTFTHIPEFVRDDLGSLEREGVLYADHWVEELRDFRHVRIALTNDEAKDYARRCWAYELWLRARSPKWAKDVPGIDMDVANEADLYPPNNIASIVKVRRPYHCFAAFLGSHLEKVSCTSLPDRTTIIELQGKESALFTLTRAIHSLTPTIRSFNSREKGLAKWQVDREDDVRDLLYVMLKPVLFDLIKEEAIPSVAVSHKFVDLASKVARIFIEVKWVARRHQWKAIVRQIQVDIQSYPAHKSCETIIFVVVDAARDIPDPRLIEKELSGQQVIRDRNVDVRVFIVEP